MAERGVSGGLVIATPWGSDADRQDVRTTAQHIPTAFAVPVPHRYDVPLAVGIPLLQAAGEVCSKTGMRCLGPATAHDFMHADYAPPARLSSFSPYDNHVFITMDSFDLSPLCFLKQDGMRGEGDSGGGNAELATGLPQIFTKEFVSRGPPMPPGLAAMLLPYFLPLLIPRIQQQIWHACRRVRLNVVGKAVRLVVADAMPEALGVAIVELFA
eukprot:1578094-Pleurochrysis_carterae.AAC.1